MAVAAFVPVKLNGDAAGPHSVGRRKCAYVKFTVVASSVYATGGIPLSNKLEALFGIRFVGQMEFLRVQIDDTVTDANGAATGLGAQWDRANQAVVLYVSEDGAVAQVAADTPIASLEIDAVCWTE
jgi:hypothetical protein